jgi:hypothetical protein
VAPAVTNRAVLLLLPQALQHLCKAGVAGCLCCALFLCFFLSTLLAGCSRQQCSTTPSESIEWLRPCRG